MIRGYKLVGEGKLLLIKNGRGHFRLESGCHFKLKFGCQYEWDLHFILQSAILPFGKKFLTFSIL
jgi:hypothetical protein